MVWIFSASHRLQRIHCSVQTIKENNSFRQGSALNGRKSILDQTAKLTASCFPDSQPFPYGLMHNEIWPSYGATEQQIQANDEPTFRRSMLTVLVLSKWPIPINRGSW